MKRLFCAKLRKLWRSRAFCVALAALMSVNLFLIWSETKPSGGQNASTAYHAMQAALTDKSMEQKGIFLAEEYDRIRAMQIINSVLQQEAWNGGAVDTRLRDKYVPEFAAYYDAYCAGGYLTYTQNLNDEYRFITRIKTEYDTVAGYDAFLDSVSEKAAQLSSISIFANSSDPYSMRNIKLTALAYEDMRSVVVNYTPQYGVTTALDFSLTDMVAVLLLLLLATVLVREEKDNGLLRLIRSAPAGRSKTAIAKWLALAASLFFVLMALYGVNLLYCQTAFGLGDLSRSIQSVPLLLRSTLNLSVGQYLGLFLFTKWLAALVAGTWVLFIMLAAEHIMAGYAGALALIGANLLIRQLIPATSRLNILKYANLISLLKTNELLGIYHNLYWFGHPVPLAAVEGITALAAGSLFFILFHHTFAKGELGAHRHRAPLRRPSFLRRKRFATTILRQETAKLLFMNGAIFVIVISVIFGGYQVATTESYLDADEIYYRYYMQKVEGPYTMDTVAKLQEMQAEFVPIYNLQAALQSKKITTEDYQSMMSAYGNLQQKMKAFERVVGKLSYLKDKPRAEIVYESGYVVLFDLADRHDVQDALLCCLATVLSFAGLFSIEAQSGMRKVICATPLGRETTARTKLGVTAFYCGILALCSAVPRMIVAVRAYGLACFIAPTYSMYEYGAAVELPFFFLLFLFIAARFVALLAVAYGMLALSSWLGNTVRALFVGSAIFCLPLLLASSGLPAAKWISVYPAFHIAAMFTQNSSAIFALLVLAVCGEAAFYCGMWLCDEFGHVK